MFVKHAAAGACVRAFRAEFIDVCVFIIFVSSDLAVCLRMLSFGLRIRRFFVDLAVFFSDLAVLGRTLHGKPREASESAGKADLNPLNNQSKNPIT